MTDHRDAFRALARHAIDEAIPSPRIVVHSGEHPGVTWVRMDDVDIPVVATVVVPPDTMYVMSSEQYDNLVDSLRDMIGRSA